MTFLGFNRSKGYKKQRNHIFNMFVNYVFIRIDFELLTMEQSLTGL